MTRLHGISFILNMDVNPPSGTAFVKQKLLYLNILSEDYMFESSRGFNNIKVTRFNRNMNLSIDLLITPTQDRGRPGKAQALEITWLG